VKASRLPITDESDKGWHWRRPFLVSQKGGVMTEVRLRDEDSLERALKLFKRKLQKSGLFGELRRRRHYVKPSEARAIKIAAAARRKRKKGAATREW
jgi:small subunit ribosomal protein S21